MTQTLWSNLLPLAIGTHAEHHAHLSLHLHDDQGRGELEHFIHQCFADAHQADIHHYLPELLALRDSHGRLIAAAGVSLGRECMVEVGNLASLSAGSARIMITAVTWLLATRGLQWVAFTGASTLINSFQRLGLVPTVVAQADPARLSEPAQHWGYYYDQHPQVF